jgi:hypothetical protein
MRQLGLFSFFVDDGNLFLKCPLFDQLGACLKLIYFLDTPFKVPCKALHPNIEVSNNVEDTEGQFTYIPTDGFSGYLKKRKRRFECIASYDGLTQNMIFDMAKAEVSELVVRPPNTIERINDIFIAVQGDQLNLTCDSTLDCDLPAYDIQFDVVSQTGSLAFTKSMSSIGVNRSECGIGSRTVAFNRTLTLDNLFENVSVACNFFFGKDLSKKSDVYQVLTVPKPFISYDELNFMEVRYLAIGYVTLRFNYSTSSVLDRNWFFNDKPLVIGDSDIFEDCRQYETFKFSCELTMPAFTDNDAGLYSLRLGLKHYPNSIVDLKNGRKYIELNATLISTKAPDLTIAKPVHCSANFTCELNRVVEFQCNAQAYEISDKLMVIVECDGLDDCYTKMKNSTFVSQILDDNRVEDTVSSLKKQIKIEQSYLVICYAMNDMGKKIRLKKNSLKPSPI